MKMRRAITSIVLVALMMSLFPVNASAATVKENRFYSMYDPDVFNDKYATGDRAYLEYRMNCYCYALRVFYGGALKPGYSAGANPGDFALSADKSKVLKYDNTDAPSVYMEKVIYNMYFDAKRLGYFISEYIVPDNGVVTQVVSGARMIAVVTGNIKKRTSEIYDQMPTDYHFYMQHSDGTWSYKDGRGVVSNEAMDYDDNSTLNNENIARKANQGRYHNGKVRFFIITKDAVCDYPYGDLDSVTNEIPFNLTDVAGDSPETSSEMFTGSIDANIDFINDKDTYSFMPVTSGYYKFSTVDKSGEGNLNAQLYNSQKETISSDMIIGEVNLRCYLTAGQKYYIKIYNNNGMQRFSYTLNLKRTT